MCTRRWTRRTPAIHIFFTITYKKYIFYNEGDLLQHDPVAVPLDGGQVGEEAGPESAEAGADADAHDQLARLLTVPHVVLVQGDLFGELGLNKSTLYIIDMFLH